MKRITGYICSGLISVFLFAGCGNNGSPDVKLTEDNNGFYMEYSDLNGTESCDIELSEGDELQIEFTNDHGKTDISVCRDAGSPIYAGKDQTDASFIVSAPENGKYRISVTGHSAAGHFSCNKNVPDTVGQIPQTEITRGKE